MNLVAYEYIACQEGHNGVLILSEFAGAAQSLGAGALQVNPWNISEVADAIEESADNEGIGAQDDDGLFVQPRDDSHSEKLGARIC